MGHKLYCKFIQSDAQSWPKSSLSMLYAAPLLYDVPAFALPGLQKKNRDEVWRNRMQVCRQRQAPPANLLPKETASDGLMISPANVEHSVYSDVLCTQCSCMRKVLEPF